MKQKSTPCRFLKLPYFYDEQLLLRDLSICLETEWTNHFNTRDYSGDWTSISLYSASGETQDIRTESAAGFSPTKLAGQCEYFNGIIDSLRCEKESVRLLRLAPGSEIHEHRDIQLAYEHGIFRLHIPIITGPGVDFIVDNERLDMKSGECWYANFDLPHRVSNKSDQPRVHFVIDCKRNAWSDDLFEKTGYDLIADKKMREPDEETRKRIITELLRIDSETSRALASRLAGQMHGDELDN